MFNVDKESCLCVGLQNVCLAKMFWNSPPQPMEFIKEQPPARNLSVAVRRLLHYRAGIFKESVGTRNKGGIGLSYRPARLHRLAESIPWNRFLGSLKV